MAILQLLNYRFTDLSIHYVPPADSDSKEHSLQLEPKVKIHEKSEEQLYELRFKLNIDPGDGGGLRIEAVFEGLFQAPEMLSGDEALELVQTNGLSLLYSTLRGEIAHLTSSFPVEKVLLPTIPIKPFQPPAKKKKAAKKKTTSKKTSKKVTP